MIRVLLADDHAIVRGGLKEILARHLESVECSEAESAEQVLAQVRERPLDLLILDITLSPREFEILIMIASGNAVGEIAEKLHLSGTTVSTHRARILEKMHMTTTAQLIRYAVRNRLVD